MTDNKFAEKKTIFYRAGMHIRSQDLNTHVCNLRAQAYYTQADFLMAFTAIALT